MGRTAARARADGTRTPDQCTPARSMLYQHRDRYTFATFARYHLLDMSVPGRSCRDRDDSQCATDSAAQLHGSSTRRKATATITRSHEASWPSPHERHPIGDTQGLLCLISGRLSLKRSRGRARSRCHVFAVPAGTKARVRHVPPAHSGGASMLHTTESVYDRDGDSSHTQGVVTGCHPTGANRFGAARAASLVSRKR
jgi:hypothetical protein